MNETSRDLIVDELLNHALHQPVQDFLGRQGKRIRASMMQLTHKICQGETLPPEIMDSVELLHAGSLVIDDIQDDSALRRGHVTMHRERGVPLAINAGNFMYFRALEVIANANVPVVLQGALSREMIRAGRVCHEGQALDLLTKADVIDPSDWRVVARAITFDKTGTLVALAMRLGAMSANAPQPLADRLGRFGEQIGVALQMHNDLTEILSFARCETDRHDDLKLRRVTWPWVWFFEANDRTCAREFAATVLKRSMLGDCEGIRAVAREMATDVCESGQKEITRRVDETLCLLAEHVVDPELLEALSRCLDPLRVSTQQGVNSDSSYRHGVIA
ncbi:MAG: polyprenyl synthetase family protein [Planctomycetota bacterium]